MHITFIDRIRGGNEAMHTSVSREKEECRARREAREMEGIIQAPRHRAGRPRRAIS